MTSLLPEGTTTETEAKCISGPALTYMNFAMSSCTAAMSGFFSVPRRYDEILQVIQVLLIELMVSSSLVLSCYEISPRALTNLETSSSKSLSCTSLFMSESL